jgi:hypothetical protein
MESGYAGVYWSNGQKKFSVRVLKRSSTQGEVRKTKGCCPTRSV